MLTYWKSGCPSPPRRTIPRLSRGIQIYLTVRNFRCTCGGNTPPGAMSGMWKRSHGRTTKAPPDANCMFGYIGPTVKGGRFSTVPYEYDASGVLHASSKKAMLGMPYTVNIGTIGPQPPDVERVIGYFGTNLRGPLVSAWPGAIPGFQVQATRRITIGVRAD